MSQRPQFALILPAAGRSTRFGGEKLGHVIAGRSILEHSICAFIERSDVSSIIVITREPSSPLPVSKAVADHPKLSVCGGGEHRAQSVLRGLEALAGRAASIEFVAIHDAARPAVSQSLVDRVFDAAARHGAAVPALAVSDTIKRVQEGRVIETVRRAELVAAQTPQGMRRGWLVDAFARCPVPLEQVTDDAQLLELAGFAVAVVEGEAGNLKVTRPQDVEQARRILLEGPDR